MFFQQPTIRSPSYPSGIQNMCSPMEYSTTIDESKDPDTQLVILSKLVTLSNSSRFIFFLYYHQIISFKSIDIVTFTIISFLFLFLSMYPTMIVFSLLCPCFLYMRTVWRAYVAPSFIPSLLTVFPPTYSSVVLIIIIIIIITKSENTVKLTFKFYDNIHIVF